MAKRGEMKISRNVLLVNKAQIIKVKSWNTIGSDSLLSELRITGVKKTYFYQDSKTIFSNAIVNQILTLHSHADNEKELKFHLT